MKYVKPFKLEGRDANSSVKNNVFTSWSADKTSDLNPQLHKPIKTYHANPV